MNEGTDTPTEKISPSTAPPGSAEELAMASEMIIGYLAWISVTENRLKIKSAEQFYHLYEEMQKDAIRVTFEAMKTKEGTEGRLSRVQELWEMGSDWLSHNHNHAEGAKVALGLSILRMSITALRGNIMMIEFPKIRERILRMDENARKKAAKGLCPKCGVELPAHTHPCGLAEGKSLGITTSDAETSEGPKIALDDLMKQARRVRSYSNPDDVFEAIPVSAIAPELCGQNPKLTDAERSVQ